MCLNYNFTFYSFCIENFIYNLSISRKICKSVTRILGIVFIIFLIYSAHFYPYFSNFRGGGNINFRYLDYVHIQSWYWVIKVFFQSNRLSLRNAYLENWLWWLPLRHTYRNMFNSTPFLQSVYSRTTRSSCSVPCVLAALSVSLARTVCTIL